MKKFSFSTNAKVVYPKKKKKGKSVSKRIQENTS